MPEPVTIAVALANLGFRIAQVVVRSQGLSGAADWADLVGDVGGTTEAAKLPQLLRRTGAAKLLGDAVTNELTQRLAGIPNSEPQRATDLAVAAERVASLIEKIGRTPEAMVEAAQDSDKFHHWVLDNGGTAVLATTEDHATPFAQQLIRTTCGVYSDLILANPSFPPAAIQTILRTIQTLPHVTETTDALLQLNRRMESTLTEMHVATVRKPLHIATLEDLRAATASARDASRPKYMPPIDRRAELGLSDGSRIKTPLVIIGEGGAGKSVLAGDLVDWTAGPCVLVPCSRVPANVDLRTLAAIDSALGDAASDARHGVPLTQILESMPDRVLLVVDTLDLLLTADTADNLAHLLRELESRCDLIVTSRDQEWHDLMGHDVLPEHRLGWLTSEQVMIWVDAYIAARSGISSEVTAAFRRSVSSAVFSGGGRVLLGSPVRLAMACSLYAPSGTLPPGLSVPQLYGDYWTQNVVLDRRGRRLTPSADAQEATALEVASRIWHGSSTIFKEYVPRMGLSPEAVQDLLSSGLLKTNGSTLIGFFHQTFAEFAVARGLAALASPEDIKTLGAALTANSPAHWGVARYLAWSEMDASLAFELADAIPRNVEGMRVTLRLLSTRDTPEALANHLQQLEDIDEEALRKAFGALSDARPTGCPAVVDSALRLLNQPGPDLSSIANTLASVMRRLPADQQTERLTQTCTALIKIGGDVALTDLYRLLEATIAQHNHAFSIEALLPLYPRMGPAGQRVVIKAVASTSPRQLADLLAVALTVACPSTAIGDLVTIGERVWNDQTARGRLGWVSWRAILDTNYPARWSAVQVRLASRLCANDQVLLDLLHELLDPQTPIKRDLYTNAASFVAAQEPDRVATMLCSNPPGQSRAVVGNLCTIISYLGSSLSNRAIADLMELCRQQMRLDPRRVLTAMVSLAVRSPTQLDTLVRDVVLGSADPDGWISRPALYSCWDALFSSMDDVGYRRHRDDLALLVNGHKIEDRRRRTQMLGREALDDPGRWEQLIAIVHDKGHVSLAKLAVQEVITRWRVAHSMSVQPLIQLISTPHGGCARVVAIALAENLPTDWSQDDVTEVIDRLITAIGNISEDPQVAGGLMMLVSRLAHQLSTGTLIDAAVVRKALAAYRAGLDAAMTDHNLSRASALLDQWLSVMSRIGVFRLSADEVAVNLRALLVEIDTAQIGTNSTRGLATSLIGITGNLPGIWQSLSATWRNQPPANQTATAEALIRGRIPGGREIALERAREDCCPAQLAQRIHQLLDS